MRIKTLIDTSILNNLEFQVIPFSQSTPQFREYNNINLFHLFEIFGRETRGEAIINYAYNILAVTGLSDYLPNVGIND